MSREPIERAAGAGSTEAAQETGSKAKKPFLHSSFYDTSDIEAASAGAYDTELDAERLKRQRRRDWIWLVIGVPAFIAFIYLVALIFGGAH